MSALEGVFQLDDQYIDYRLTVDIVDKSLVTTLRFKKQITPETMCVGLIMLAQMIAHSYGFEVDMNEAKPKEPTHEPDPGDLQ